MKIKQILNSLWWKHKCFWGNRYRVVKDGKTVETLLIYHKKIYILKDGGNKWKISMMN